MNDEQLAAVFAALGHPLRLALWRLLLLHGAEGLAVGVIAMQLPSAPSSLTLHLKQMVGAGVLTQSREGQRITYAVSEEALDAAAKLLIAD